MSNRRMLGMRSSLIGPNVQGYTHTTMSSTKGIETVRTSKSPKAALIAGWSLQIDTMKCRSLVYLQQHAPGKMLSGLLHTARLTP